MLAPVAPTCSTHLQHVSCLHGAFLRRAGSHAGASQRCVGVQDAVWPRAPGAATLPPPAVASRSCLARALVLTPDVLPRSTPGDMVARALLDLLEPPAAVCVSTAPDTCAQDVSHLPGGLPGQRRQRQRHRPPARPAGQRWADVHAVQLPAARALLRGAPLEAAHASPGSLTALGQAHSEGSSGALQAGDLQAELWPKLMAGGPEQPWALGACQASSQPRRRCCAGHRNPARLPEVRFGLLCRLLTVLPAQAQEHQLRRLGCRVHANQTHMAHEVRPAIPRCLLTAPVSAACVHSQPAAGPIGSLKPPNLLATAAHCAPSSQAASTAGKQRCGCAQVVNSYNGMLTDAWTLTKPVGWLPNATPPAGHHQQLCQQLHHVHLGAVWHRCVLCVGGHACAMTGPASGT